METEGGALSDEGASFANMFFLLCQLLDNVLSISRQVFDRTNILLFSTQMLQAILLSCSHIPG